MKGGGRGCVPAALRPVRLPPQLALLPPMTRSHGAGQRSQLRVLLSAGPGLRSPADPRPSLGLPEDHPAGDLQGNLREWQERGGT